MNISDYYKSIEQVVGYEQYLSDFENEIMFPFTQDKETEITDFFVSVNLKVSHLVNSKLSHLRYNKPYI